MKRFAWSFLIGSVAAGSVVGVDAGEDCYERVEPGDPVSLVIERCGEPVRRELGAYAPEKQIEVIRGADTRQSYPLQRRPGEKWYFDTVGGRPMLIEIQDGGVVRKQRLESLPPSPGEVK